MWTVLVAFGWMSLAAPAHAGRSTGDTGRTIPRDTGRTPRDTGPTRSTGDDTGQPTRATSDTGTATTTDDPLGPPPSDAPTCACAGLGASYQALLLLAPLGLWRRRPAGASGARFLAAGPELSRPVPPRPR